MPVPRLPKQSSFRRSGLPANRGRAKPRSSFRSNPTRIAPKASTVTRRARPSGITATSGCSACQKAARLRAERARNKKAASNK